MTETRGRKQNSFMVLKVKEMKKEGKGTNVIADAFGITAPMVRYYLRQKDIIPEQRRGSIAGCFFKQPKEVQERIAAEIGYVLPQDSIQHTKPIKVAGVK